MTLKELIARFRTDIDDVASPPLWSDDYVVACLNEAEQEACRRSELLLDSSTPEIVSVTAVSGEAFISIDPRILVIKRVRQAASNPVAIVSASYLDGNPTWEAETGPYIRALISDLETDKLRAYPIPTADLALTFTVQRLPLEDLSRSALTGEPEIRAQHHLKLVYWALYRAYAVDDTDVHDDQKSAKWLKLFEREFGTTSASQETWLRMHGGRDLMTGYFA